MINIILGLIILTATALIYSNPDRQSRRKSVILSAASFVLTLTVLSGCVTRSRYMSEINLIVRLKQDSADLSRDNFKLKDSLKVRRLVIGTLKADSVQRIAFFDKTANELIQTSNARLDSITAEYRRIMSTQISRSNTQLLNSLRQLFPASVFQNAINFENQNQTIKIKFNVDSLYDRDSLNFNKKGLLFIAKFNTPEFLNITSNYYINAQNSVTYRDTADARSYTIIYPSLILEELLRRINSASIAVQAGNQRSFQRNYVYQSQNIEIGFSKGFEAIHPKYIQAKAVNGIFVKRFDEQVRVDYDRVLASSGDIAISYPIKSDKYLFYPSDYIVFGFENATDDQLLKKINLLQRNSPKSILVMHGDDKRTISCSCLKAIVVVAGQRILKKIPSINIDCNPDVLKL